MAQLNLSDFSEQNRAIIESSISADQYKAPETTLGRGLALTAQGISDGVAGMVGLPSDLISAMLRKGGFDVGNEQFLGSESIKSALTYLGARPEIQAKTTAERYIRRIAEEFGYFIPIAGPLLGWGRRAARLGGVGKIPRAPIQGPLKRTRELGRKMFTDPPMQRTVPREPATTRMGKIRQAGRGYLERVGADPMGTLRREGVAIAAAGAGAQTGRELFPDSLAAEITGQFLGPAGLMALKYVPTPLRAAAKSYKYTAGKIDEVLDEAMISALKQVDPKFIDPKIPGSKETIERFRDFKILAEQLGLDFDLYQYSMQDKRLKALFQQIPFTEKELDALRLRHANNADTIEKLKVYVDSNNQNFAELVDVANVGPVAKGTKDRIVNKISLEEKATAEKMLDVGVEPVSVTVFDDTVDDSGYLVGRKIGTKKTKTPIQPWRDTEYKVKGEKGTVRGKSGIGGKMREELIEIHDQDFLKVENTAESLGLNVAVEMGEEAQERIIEIAQQYNKYIRYNIPTGQIAQADLIDIAQLRKQISGPSALKSLRNLFHNIGRREGPLLAGMTRSGENATQIIGLATMKRSLEDVLDDVGRNIEGKLFSWEQAAPELTPEMAQKMDAYGMRYVMEDVLDESGNVIGREALKPEPQPGLFWDKATNTAKNPSLLDREFAFREYFKKEYLDKWRTGVPMRVRSKNRYGFWTTPSERIATAFFGSGGSGNIRQYLNVFPEGRHHLEAALMDDIWHKATIEMGRTKKGEILRVLDPDRFNKWMTANNSRNYEKLLAMDIDPEKFLLEELEVMKGLQQRMRVLQNRKQVINNNAMIKSLSSYGGLYKTQPTKEIMDAVNDLSGNKMRSLLSIVRGNQAALDGIKQSVWNFGMKLDTPQLAGWLHDKKNNLSLLFAPNEGKMVWTKNGYAYKGGVDHLEKMERILSARIMHEAGEAAIPLPTGEPPTRFKQFEEFMGQSFPSLSNQVWTLYSRFLPARIVVARMMSSLFRRMSTDKWNDALKDMFLNPNNADYMDKLVRASNPYGEKISSLRRLHLNWMLLGLEPMSKDTISRESLQSEIPIQDYNKYKKQAEILRKRIEAGDFRRLPAIPKKSTEFSVAP